MRSQTRNAGATVTKARSIQIVLFHINIYIAFLIALYFWWLSLPPPAP